MVPPVVFRKEKKLSNVPLVLHAGLNIVVSETVNEYVIVPPDVLLREKRVCAVVAVKATRAPLRSPGSTADVSVGVMGVAHAVSENTVSVPGVWMAAPSTLWNSAE